MIQNKKIKQSSPKRQPARSTTRPGAGHSDDSDIDALYDERSWHAVPRAPVPKYDLASLPSMSSMPASNRTASPPRSGTSSRTASPPMPDLSADWWTAPETLNAPTDFYGAKLQELRTQRSKMEEEHAAAASPGAPAASHAEASAPPPYAAAPRGQAFWDARMKELRRRRSEMEERKRRLDAALAHAYAQPDIETRVSLAAKAVEMDALSAGRLPSFPLPSCRPDIGCHFVLTFPGGFFMVKDAAPRRPPVDVIKAKDQPPVKFLTKYNAIGNPARCTMSSLCCLNELLCLMVGAYELLKATSAHAIDNDPGQFYLHNDNNHEIYVVLRLWLGKQHAPYSRPDWYTIQFFDKQNFQDKLFFRLNAVDVGKRDWQILGDPNDVPKFFKEHDLGQKEIGGTLKIRPYTQTVVETEVKVNFSLKTFKQDTRDAR